MRGYGTNRRGYFVRAKLYPSQINENQEIVRTIELVTPLLFRAKDASCQGLNYASLAGVYQRQATNKAIETVDLLPTTVKVHDTVEYEGTLFTVLSVTVSDENKAKEFSNRPRTKLTLELGALA